MATVPARHRREAAGSRRSGEGAAALARLTGIREAHRHQRPHRRVPVRARADRRRAGDEAGDPGRVLRSARDGLGALGGVAPERRERRGPSPRRAPDPPRTSESTCRHRRAARAMKPLTPAAGFPDPEGQFAAALVGRQRLERPLPGAADGERAGRSGQRVVDSATGARAEAAHRRQHRGIRRTRGGSPSRHRGDHRRGAVARGEVELPTSLTARAAALQDRPAADHRVHDEVPRLLKVASVILAIALVGQFVFRFVVQESFYDWLGDRIDTNLTD